MRMNTSGNFVIMTGSRLYLDTAPFIYFLEKSNLYFEQIRNFFIRCKNNKIFLITSTVTIEEYCVYPLSQNNNQAVSDFNTFLSGMNIEVVPVDKTIGLKAAEFRAKYKGFKALDAIHLATAIQSGCTIFVTNDKQLRQSQEISVLTMENLKELDFSPK